MILNNIKICLHSKNTGYIGSNLKSKDASDLNFLQLGKFITMDSEKVAFYSHSMPKFFFQTSEHLRLAGDIFQAQVRDTLLWGDIYDITSDFNPQFGVCCLPRAHRSFYVSNCLLNYVGLFIFCTQLAVEIRYFL